ncbi:hypothetical protein [Campylobacter pinnipediorum]|uniref:Uncharacterized protein n=1 Tax=Campylobacter pinnipediorum subsp. pinnipediorum TaxID=1660067 RepID=A0AAX0LAX8_9BACT|nr:hypothetical protein [Campylobacter pinnipediorum]AQW83396.1 hypothetical protein CPIN17261_1399 [Campylobacter pinnipediorum subsp. pinnipediorum]AQW84917.1 hypothetical protein CPIN17262_1244 [Campylobacter pinnipediorum subsp. pinnipediorum]OPA81626.1 hypothetical protein BFG04_00330 [Campylobacter pinnipediorum subsp. pinnipediorum]
MNSSNLSKISQMSTTRLPLDHFVSGALASTIATLVFEYSKNSQLSNIDVKKLLKNGAIAGIASASAIYTANSIAKGKYLEAGFGLVAGVSGALLIEKTLK